MTIVFANYTWGEEQKEYIPGKYPMEELQKLIEERATEIKLKSHWEIRITVLRKPFSAIHELPVGWELHDIIAGKNENISVILKRKVCK